MYIYKQDSMRKSPHPEKDCAQKHKHTYKHMHAHTHTHKKKKLSVWSRHAQDLADDARTAVRHQRTLGHG